MYLVRSRALGGLLFFTSSFASGSSGRPAREAARGWRHPTRASAQTNRSPPLLVLTETIAGDGRLGALGFRAVPFGRGHP